MNENIKKVFFKRHITYIAVFIAIILIYIISAIVTEFKMNKGIASFSRGMDWRKPYT